MPPPPPDGEFIFFPPPEGIDGELPPPPDGFMPPEGFMPPPPPEGFEGDMSFVIPPPPDGFVGDGGFYAPPEGFDPDGMLFVPPEGFVGDAIFLPPPPEHFEGDGFYFPPSADGQYHEGFEAPPDFFEVYHEFPPPPPDFVGEWQPPPPQEWDGSSDWMPPPPEHLYADGEWFPPPPPPNWEGEWFPPPPPPVGLEEFPDEFFFSNRFDDFFHDERFVEQGFVEQPPRFEEFPFDMFLEEYTLHDIIPQAPPMFEHGAFGEFQFGFVPPPPPGFPSFPPPPEFLGSFGDFGAAFGPPPGEFPDGMPPDPLMGPPIGPPPNLPPGFFEFRDQVNQLNTFLQSFAFPPPPVPYAPGEGPYPPGDEPYPPGDEPYPDGYLPPIAFVTFEQIADLLPPDFLLPEEAVEVFENFGTGHPLIGDGGVVNPQLEQAMLDHPPVPEGYDGFDFDGDRPQFDDLFTVYNEDNVGETVRGQINATLNTRLEDGTAVRSSDTTVIETVQEAATPLVEMEPGVYQTQWVVNIRELTNSVIEVVDADDPEAGVEAEQTREVLSQMTWIMLIQEVDVDGDGTPDEIRVSGSNNVEVLSESVEGGPPEGLPPLPPPPQLMLPLDFEGVLDMNTPEEEEQQEEEQQQEEQQEEE